MGRSKFPGKPSKHVNRKRINVLPPTIEGIIECSKFMTVTTIQENKQEQEDVESNDEGIKFKSPVNTTVSLRRRLNRNMQSSKALLSNNSTKRGLIAKLCNKNNVKAVSCKITVKSKLNCKGSRRSAIQRKSVHGFSTIKNFKRNVLPKESNNLVGKFVLPTRSVHSSRVIKPNKRFINVELSDTLALKKRVINKKRCMKQNENKTKSRVQDSAVSDDSSARTFTNGRIVLRQARLKLHNQVPEGSEGPFSCTSTNGSPPGTVTCGVCGAVRFYRFVKQARKFNIYSCESCRKFISKMIKRQSCGKDTNGPTLVCHKGQGMCHVPPIVRSQQMKLIRCAYRSRCPACWLKMCLRSFQMPMSLKHSLIQLLPKNMQGSDVIFSNSLPLLWQVSVQNVDSRMSKHATSDQTETENQRPVRLKSNVKTGTQTAQSQNCDVKRQKIDLKGPRVKHVCRSASIVLGQAVATFPTEDKKKTESQNNFHTVKAAQNGKNISVDATEIQQNVKTSKDVNSSENESSDNDKVTKVSSIFNENVISQIKRDRSHRVPFSISSSASFSSPISSLTSLSYTLPTTIAARNKIDEQKTCLQDYQNMLLLDYWANCDFDDVNQHGFCLIASKQFPMPAICFLCGSAGRETLLHCSLCCEPYHPYCLEQSTPLVTNNSSKKEFIWFCPRCTTCSVCKKADRCKLNCQKCSKTYHSECCNTSWIDKDKLSVCSKCVTCKDCGLANTIKFLGNLPLCILCFKLRKKGIACPLCEETCEDGDFNKKMVECTKCNKWMHAECEGLSEEHYYMLSVLPESIKYLCSACSNYSVSNWYKAVDAEMKFNLNLILRLLCKNKIAKNLIKLSSSQNNTNSLKESEKKLQYNDTQNDCRENHSSTIYFYNYTDSSEKDVENQTSTGYKNGKNLTLLDIKCKLNSNAYDSVKIFNREIEEALNRMQQAEQLLDIYRSLLKSLFPWFKATKTDNDSKLTDKIRRFLTTPICDEDVCEQIECVSIDSRYCSFCKSIGDGLSHLESRLLYCGQNEWVHINCALWSSEVYEEIDGSLQNVHSALSRGRLMRCSYCKQKGATVGCCFKNCTEIYHFICARTAKCHFMHDKTVYCCNHELPKTSSVIVTPTDFNIRRIVFVEPSDNKKGQFSQIDKVNVMVGSLCVTNLGKINPLMSDNAEAIIPTGYSCTRLFWSTVEPWRLVSYKISTSVSNAHVSNLQVDKSFTVDHSLPKAVVERKLKEVSLWHKDIDKKRQDSAEYDDEEEPQNGADLLSPEITDAIFEELPHELLDGISVQDIFPKLMSYEDFINVDSKSESNNSNSNSSSEAKKTEQDLEFEDKESRHKYETGPELLTKSKSQQRSCSLTLSCKLDNSFSPVIKKRKIAPRENNVFFQLLQVDGNFDDSSSDCGSPTGTIDTLWESDLAEKPVTCEKCQCTYRTRASYKRHLDVCEVICTSESDSELNQDQDANVGPENFLDTETEISQPIVIAAYESYQNEIHTSVLNTQTFVASKSTELISVPQNTDMIMPHLHEKAILQPEISCDLPTITNQPVTNDTFIRQSAVSLNEPVTIAANQPAQFCLNPGVSLCVSSPLNLPVNTVNNSIINHAIAPLSVTQPTSVQPLEFQAPSVAIQSLPYSGPIINVTPSNQVTFTDKLLNNPNIINSVINVPANRWLKPSEQTGGFCAKTHKGKGRARSIVAKRNHEEEETILVPQANSAAAPVIVQHLPSTSFIPTFVDTFQHQSGQNVQYVATIAPQMNSTLHPQQLVQFQTDGNLISLLPGIQPTMIIQQPRVLENQLILDSNGSLSWTPHQVQPVYYGFETIVQNTVMQSQQFLPSTVPGVLTANSSYSTTTQVFQTSKLEPVLDMAANSFVLVNPGQLVNSQPLQVHQTQPVTKNLNVLTGTEITQNKYSAPSFQKVNNHVTAINSNSITLPTAPFVSEQRIPTNIVTPTPKSVTNAQSRPMSRVLPMPTLKETNKINVYLDKIDAVRREVKQVTKDPQVVVDFAKELELVNQEKSPVELQLDVDLNKKDPSLRLIFQKQSQDGSYKISNDFTEEVTQPATNVKTNNFSTKTNMESAYKMNNNFNNRNSPVQIAPLKPIKSAFNSPKPLHILSLSDKQNRQQEKVEKKITFETSKHFVVEKKENENNLPSILYTIETQDGFKYSSTSITDLWTKVFEAVQNARAAHNMPLLPSDSGTIMNSLQILGLKTSGLKYLIEQLPGATKCAKYRPCFNFPSKHAEIEEELIGHTSGSARCAPLLKRNEQYDMFGWLASKHRKPEHSLFCSELVPRRGSVTNLPMAMRFRQLKLTSKYSVGVYRSRIHRRGLFCLRDFEAGEMVIEYSGEVIRSVLTDKREKFYNSKGIGCYMFRIDDNLVVDATMTGNAARFINHSCDPNCYSKVVEILGHKHIIIFALRRIICGEELTYDYKFPIEEDKIPCTCGARRCRKFLN